MKKSRAQNVKAIIEQNKYNLLEEDYISLKKATKLFQFSEEEIKTEIVELIKKVKYE